MKALRLDGEVLGRRPTRGSPQAAGTVGALGVPCPAHAPHSSSSLPVPHLAKEVIREVITWCWVQALTHLDSGNCGASSPHSSLCSGGLQALQGYAVVISKLPKTQSFPSKELIAWLEKTKQNDLKCVSRCWFRSEEMEAVAVWLSSEMEELDLSKSFRAPLDCGVNT